MNFYGISKEALLYSQAFEKFTTRPMMGRKELLKITLRKAAHGWKLIVDLRLTGNLHF
ncbi:putative acyl-CoA oxidase [Helianthus anomalus]